MPEFLSVSLGVIFGLAIIAGAIFLAVRPYVQARPPKRRMPDATDAKDDYSNTSMASGESHHGSGGDGHSG
jgi:hypothetical protein